MLSQDLKIELITNKLGMVTCTSPTCELSTGMCVIHSIDDEDRIWIFTKLPEIEISGKPWLPWISLTIQDTNQHLFLGLSGRVHIELDEGIKKEFLNADIQNWFPGSHQQPDLILMALVVRRVNRWDVLNGEPFKSRNS